MGLNKKLLLLLCLVLLMPSTSFCAGGVSIEMNELSAVAHAVNLLLHGRISGIMGISTGAIAEDFAFLHKLF